MQGFRSEDYALSREITEATGADIRPSVAREIAGHWMAAKLNTFLRERTGTAITGGDLVAMIDKLEAGDL